MQGLDLRVRAFSLEMGQCPIITAFLEEWVKSGSVLSERNPHPDARRTARVESGSLSQNDAGVLFNGCVPDGNSGSLANRCIRDHLIQRFACSVDQLRAHLQVVLPRRADVRVAGQLLNDMQRHSAGQVGAVALA